jgi:hypothetical protein
MTTDLTMKALFESAATLGEFVAAARENVELWTSMSARARVPVDLVERARRVPGRRHLLVLLEDWCGDGVNTVPAIAALAAAVPELELRVVARDEHPALMDAHLTNGTRSIPIVIVLDEHFRELGWWGPRPAELQRWVLAEGQALAKPERYREVRRWYARDRARTTIEEVVALLERTSLDQAA